MLKINLERTVMRYALFALALALVAWNSIVAQQPGAQLNLPDNRTKASYIIGTNIGGQMKADDLNLDLNALMKGIQDGMAGAPPAMTQEEMQKVMTAFRQEVEAIQAKKAAAAGGTNKDEGLKFLAANKAQPGVTTLPSGLQYKVLKQGNGPSPKSTDQVTTHYRGTLINGKVFDSSYDRGQPATFPVNGVIKGWTEALQLMKVGDKWQLYVPSELAYGERGAGQDIGPNSVLIFEVELISIGK
jgi:FKBP-type peptidyl-prolyl cis-trans isomerase FklB